MRTGARVLLAVLTWVASADAADPAIPVAPAPSATAPGIEPLLARRAAQDTLVDLEARETKGARIPGVYVAFDTATSTPYSLAACDDDGDYVVVVSDPLLVLLDFVAEATADDDALGTHRLDDYASALTRSPDRTARLLAPPTGFFAEGTTDDATLATTHDARFDEMLAWILADELAHARTDLVCAAPTVTREAGDSVWTKSERATSFAVAAKLATAPAVRTADARADARVLASGRTTRGRDAWLRFVAEAGGESSLGTYAHLHPR